VCQSLPDAGWVVRAVADLVSVTELRLSCLDA